MPQGKACPEKLSTKFSLYDRLGKRSNDLNQDLRKIVLARRADKDSTKVVRQGSTTQPRRFCVSPMN